MCAGGNAEGEDKSKQPVEEVLKEVRMSSVGKQMISRGSLATRSKKSASCTLIVLLG